MPPCHEAMFQKARQHQALAWSRWGGLACSTSARCFRAPFAYPVQQAAVLCALGAASTFATQHPALIARPPRRRTLGAGQSPHRHLTVSQCGSWGAGRLLAGREARGSLPTPIK